MKMPSSKICLLFWPDRIYIRNTRKKKSNTHTIRNPKHTFCILAFRRVHCTYLGNVSTAKTTSLTDASAKKTYDKIAKNCVYRMIQKNGQWTQKSRWKWHVSMAFNSILFFVTISRKDETAASFYFLTVRASAGTVTNKAKKRDGEKIIII